MIGAAPQKAAVKDINNFWKTNILFALFFISGFNALLYQVAWQRMLGLFSGSDVRSVTIVIASYLLGLGLGNLISSRISDRLIVFLRLWSGKLKSVQWLNPPTT